MEQAKRIDVIINMGIFNLINLAGICIEIAEAVMARNPEIETEDEERTRPRETDARQRYIQNRSDGLGPSALAELRAEAEEKIVKLRLRSALGEIRRYQRMSTNFIVRFDGQQNGYEWNRFFETEDAEPVFEKYAREMMTDELRDEWRHKALRYFIVYSYEYWPTIKDRDIDFLANHFSAMFPNNEYTDKLEILYGNNERRRNYLIDDELDRVWRVIHATIKLAIKYMYYTEQRTFEAGERRLTVDDLDFEIQEWAVNLDVPMDRLGFWANFITNG